MHWDDGPNAGFTAPGVTPWIPMADAGVNVADQRGDPDSVLHFVHDAIALRRRTPELLWGDYRSIPVDDRLWVWRRGTALVALNFSTERRHVAVGATPMTVALSTHRAHEGPVVGESLELDAWEGVVVTSRA
jgi:glycosidase